MKEFPLLGTQRPLHTQFRWKISGYSYIKHLRPESIITHRSRFTSSFFPASISLVAKDVQAALKYPHWASCNGLDSESHPPPPSSAEWAHTYNLHHTSMFYVHVLPGLHIWTCCIPKKQQAHGATTYCNNKDIRIFNCSFNPCLHTRQVRNYTSFDILPEYLHLCL